MLLAAVSDPWLARPTLGGNDHRRSRKQERAIEQLSHTTSKDWYISNGAAATTDFLE
jgi:hypothetical protein